MDAAAAAAVVSKIDAAFELCVQTSLRFVAGGCAVLVCTIRALDEVYSCGESREGRERDSRSIEGLTGQEGGFDDGNPSRDTTERFAARTDVSYLRFDIDFREAHKISRMYVFCAPPRNMYHPPTLAHLRNRTKGICSRCRTGVCSLHRFRTRVGN
jgi:hypothetical protein